VDFGLAPERVWDFFSKLYYLRGMLTLIFDSHAHLDVVYYTHYRPRPKPETYVLKIDNVFIRETVMSSIEFIHTVTHHYWGKTRHFLNYPI